MVYVGKITLFKIDKKWGQIVSLDIFYLLYKINFHVYDDSYVILTSLHMYWTRFRTRGFLLVGAQITNHIILFYEV